MVGVGGYQTHRSRGNICMPTITTCAFNERKTTEVTCGYESERKTRTNDTIDNSSQESIGNLSEFYLREQIK